MSTLVIETQIHENYGAHDWSGQGACPHYWKPKGGDTVVVIDIESLDVDYLKALVASISEKLEITRDDEYYREYIINWYVAEDDFITEFERQMLEFDGVVNYYGVGPRVTVDGERVDYVPVGPNVEAALSEFRKWVNS